MRNKKPLFAICLLFMQLPAVSAKSLTEELGSSAPSISYSVLSLAVQAYDCATGSEIPKHALLGVIDYSLASTIPRFWLFDLQRRKLLFTELIAHGKNTGENMAKHFSNIPGSKQSSLGLFKTGASYYGRNGYSLRLHGLETGINDNALKRAIVIHGGHYVSSHFINQHGRLGRSWGCPVLPQKMTTKMINLFKQGQYLFIYYPEDNWLKNSVYLNCKE